eukprot:COSAG03_NODE_999_length_5060_cov_5.775448_8_plen_76_part_00
MHSDGSAAPATAIAVPPTAIYTQGESTTSRQRHNASRAHAGGVASGHVPAPRGGHRARRARSVVLPCTHDRGTAD